MPVVNDSLKFIGAFTPPPTDNKALQDLQTKSTIASMNNASAESRQAGANRAGIDRAFISAGVAPGDIAGLQFNNDVNNTRLGSQTAESFANIGRGAASPPNATTRQLAMPDAPTKPDIPLKVQAATATGNAIAKGQAKTGTKSKGKFLIVDGKKIPIPHIVEEEHSSESTTTVKGSDPVKVTSQALFAQSAAELQKLGLKRVLHNGARIITTAQPDAKGMLQVIARE